MTKLVRPKEFPLAVMLALLCLTASSAQTPSPSPTPQTTQPSIVTTQLSLDEVLPLANAQASAFQSASINERIAAEDVRQAQAAFLPKVSTPLSYIYRSEEHTSELQSR